MEFLIVPQFDSSPLELFGRDERATLLLASALT